MIISQQFISKFSEQVELKDSFLLQKDLPFRMILTSKCNSIFSPEACGTCELALEASPPGVGAPSCTLRDPIETMTSGWRTQPGPGPELCMQIWEAMQLWPEYSEKNLRNSLCTVLEDLNMHVGCSLGFQTGPSQDILRWWGFVTQPCVCKWWFEWMHMQ